MSTSPSPRSRSDVELGSTTAPPACGPSASIGTVDPYELDRLHRDYTSKSLAWNEQILDSARSGDIDVDTADHYSRTFSDVYRQAVAPLDAAVDPAAAESLTAGSVQVVLGDSQADGVAMLTWYVGGDSASLSRLLPMLHSMGVVVLEERTFTVRRPDDLAVWVYQFKITPSSSIPVSAMADPQAARRFADAVIAIWHGRIEVDRFNELILRAGLAFEQVLVLRAYARYLRQVEFPYSQAHIEAILNDHPHTARALVELFEATFDPTEPARRDAHAADAAVTADIEVLVSLDTDRVLRAFASLVRATLRTNFFVCRAESARQRNAISFKLDPSRVDEIPLPRPRFEIFVYSPEMEGVHLRFGHVARGGLRWSDRREDYRTEILGLVKAQAVKNAVIVPVGAKGGFIVKQPPTPTGSPDADRDAHRAAGEACYRLFIAALLDITDNIDTSTGEVKPPIDVLRRDGDDAYLVVAADKGTATFSDIANDVAESYRFWLGDAFASGGSIGYDHKAMGITAKGAWESVKRHFRERGVDTQTEEFTVVGIGDMSGDVFGNGMLLSRHIRLIAAFDHRHIFLDPSPDAAQSWRERQRLFGRPRSSWADYDGSLISTGGGIYSRQQKSIPISPQVRAALGITGNVTELTPPMLIQAILTAPVDLLWNGGIGTYVKAQTESHADVGDRANDAVRVDGNQLRAKVIGEGGNLGITQRGRIEFALTGGHINTDALDNSAGVDCSDHEVNIKILVDALITTGKVDAAERAPLLASMTDEVKQLVLAHNSAQNDLLGTSRATAAATLNVHARSIRNLERRGLNRDLEALPTEKEIRRRAEQGLGLTSPELATLLAHVKLTLKRDVLASDLPDHDVLASRLPDYFPATLRDRFDSDIRTHQLRREIIMTTVVNDLVDTSGITFVFQIFEEAGVAAVDAVRSFLAVDAIFGVRKLHGAIRAANLPATMSDRMTIELRRLINRASRWLLNYRPQPLAIGAEITRYATNVASLASRVPEWLGGHDKQLLAREVAEYRAGGASPQLSYSIAAALYQFSLLDITDIADTLERSPAEVAETYFALMNHPGIAGLLTAVSRLPHDNRWDSLARLAIRDDIYRSLRHLCLDVLSLGQPSESTEQKIAQWRHIHDSRAEQARQTLDEVCASGTYDLASLSVAARQIRYLARSPLEVTA
jgi:glutamate dehydrogenase